MNVKMLLCASTVALSLAACAAAPRGAKIASSAAAPAQGALTTHQNAATTPVTGWREGLPPVQPPRKFGSWGYDLTAMDKSVDPGDDFDRYASGLWQARTDIPADQSSAGVGWDSYKVTEGQLRSIILEARKDSQIGALFQSYMDEERLEQLGVAPLRSKLAEVQNIGDKAAFTRFMGQASGGFGGSLVAMFAYANPNDPTMNSLFVAASGLGLPDKDYYFAEQFVKEREAYQTYLTNLFTLIGQNNPAAAANRAFEFEKQIAERFWDVADRRDFSKINNPMTVSELQSYAPGIDWSQLLSNAQIADPGTVIVTDNTALKAIAALYVDTDLETLKLWQMSQVAGQAATFLSKDFVDTHFAYSSALSGAKELRARWTRGIGVINGSLGELLGQTYVERHFPPEAKAEMEQMVVNLKAAMANRIRTNDWMAQETKAQALEKLDKMDVMVGYPDTVRDYSALRLDATDLFGNVERVGANNWDYQRAKIGKPVDKKLWAMNPQTLNAYNGSFENKIVFPAGILRPPMFSLAADDAVNYGAIGAVIGHEITHGFDDQGRKIDADGRLRDWWTPGDAERFEAKAQAFGEQYATYEAAPGHFINPDLTMGENIGDMAGLRVAYDAYKASLDGKDAPVIDGLTGDQRFFLAFAQAWQQKVRPEATIQQVSTDPHSPARFRVLGPLRNIDEWYDAFDVQPGSAFYLPPEERIKIW